MMPITAFLSLLALCNIAIASQAGVLAPAATTTNTAAFSQVTLINDQNQVSKNSAPYDGNASNYYLGYRAADFEKPYAKYWNPLVAPLNDQTLHGLEASPWASGLAYSAHEAHDYFTRPGYDNFENGWTIDGNGTLIIAVRSELPQVTGEMYDWWFAWHQIETARYKLWNPIAHTYSWRIPETVNATLSYRDRYINTTSYIAEYIGQDSGPLSVGFIEPDTLGIDRSKWPELGIETIVVANILTGNHSTSDWDGESYLMHQIRRRANGDRELRSRFWITEKNHASAQVGHDLAVHCSIEMTHLGEFLPALFEEVKDTL